MLYVEDGSDDLFFMRFVWEKAGIAHPLVHVADGQEAISYLDGKGPFKDRRKHPLPCLVLLDLNLPRKNGFEVLSWIRQHPKLKGLKVVVVSGSDRDDDIARAQSLSVIDYIVKPSGLQPLLQTIRERSRRWLKDS